MPTGKRTERVTSPEAAKTFADERRRLGDVVAWTVTRENECYVARPSCGVAYGAAIRLEAGTIDHLRRQLPKGLTAYPGGWEVVEVWI